MGRRAKEPLRPFSDDERWYLEHLSRSSSAPAVQVVRAKLLLHVATGIGYGTAAKAEGRWSGEAVAHLVQRFNQEGIEALEPRHDAGWSWQKDRSWCETGKVLRKRKAGIVAVTDPEIETKKR